MVLIKLKLATTLPSCKPTLLHFLRREMANLSSVKLTYSGFLNLVTRPFGGYFGDVIYRKFGTKGKKYLTLFCGLAMGASFLAGGIYLQNNRTAPHNPKCKCYFDVFTVLPNF